MTSKRTRLSVIVACVEAERTIDRCLGSLRTACADREHEVIVVHPCDTALAERVRRDHPWVRLLSAPQESLVPELWALGLAVSKGEVIAFSTGHCVVPPQWARALLAALAGGATGAGGALQLGPGAGVVGGAVYFLRYSAFMPPLPAAEVAEIPGDNAAYPRSALERHGAILADGFWEVEFHRRARAEGGRLVGVPEATVSIWPAFSFATILRQRFQHGRHFGAYRVSATGAPRWRGVLAAPVVPILLLTRILRRVARRPGMRVRALLTLPALLPLAAAWAAGEAWGALHASPVLTLERRPA
ncbi:hypothetical protein BH23GEM7_BH23GEM7_03530 [soil metagenome]